MVSARPCSRTAGTARRTTTNGCNEIAPGTAWLAALNARGETYSPTSWLTVSDGLEGDPFLVGPDETSPQLAGADNRTFPGAHHNDLRLGPADPAERSDREPLRRTDVAGC